MNRLAEQLEEWPERLSINDVASFLEMDRRTIRNWLASGYLPGTQLPHRWIVMRSELQEWLTTIHNQHPNFQARTDAGSDDVIDHEGADSD